MIHKYLYYYSSLIELTVYITQTMYLYLYLYHTNNELCISLGSCLAVCDHYKVLPVYLIQMSTELLSTITWLDPVELLWLLHSSTSNTGGFTPDKLHDIFLFLSSPAWSLSQVSLLVPNITGASPRSDSNRTTALADKAEAKKLTNDASHDWQLGARRRAWKLQWIREPLNQDTLFQANHM